MVHSCKVGGKLVFILKRIILLKKYIDIYIYNFFEIEKSTIRLCKFFTQNLRYYCIYDDSLVLEFLFKQKFERN